LENTRFPWLAEQSQDPGSDYLLCQCFVPKPRWNLWWWSKRSSMHEAIIAEPGYYSSITDLLHWASTPPVLNIRFKHVELHHHSVCKWGREGAINTERWPTGRQSRLSEPCLHQPLKCILSRSKCARWPNQ
jgi:hypothetical protein